MLTAFGMEMDAMQKQFTDIFRNYITAKMEYRIETAKLKKEKKDFKSSIDWPNLPIPQQKLKKIWKKRQTELKRMKESYASSQILSQLKQLIQNGVSINRFLPYNDYYSYLSQASAAGCTQLVKMLLKAGADPNFSRIEYFYNGEEKDCADPPLYCALDVRGWYRRDRKVKPSGIIKTATALIKAYANPNIEFGCCSSVFNKVVGESRKNYPEFKSIVALMLEYGADPLYRTNEDLIMHHVNDIIIAQGRDAYLERFANHWQRERIVWIGYLKEPQSPFAKCPRELIKVICNLAFMDGHDKKDIQSMIKKWNEAKKKWQNKEKKD